MIEQLTYNPVTGRVALNGHELHAGEGLTVLALNVSDDTPEWVQTRIEYSQKRKEWYLVGLPGVQLVGLFAKFED